MLLTDVEDKILVTVVDGFEVAEVAVSIRHLPDSDKR